MIQRASYGTAGYIKAGDLIPRLPPYTWMWGGRGIGKTYGVLEFVRYTKPTKFLLLRRLQTQIDLLKKALHNPFNPIDKNNGQHTAIRADKYGATFYNGAVNSDGTIEPEGAPVGVAYALATFHNIRGLDLSDIDIVIFDEFIPEPHERPIKNEFAAWENVMETVGRNRELEGRPPVQFIGLSNANELANPYFFGLGVIRVVDNMIKKGREVWTDQQRGLALINIRQSPISAQKQNTALYKCVGAGDFAAMSLGNEFAAATCSRQGTIPLQELRPCAHVGELCIYRHKARPLWYVSDHVSGKPLVYRADEMGLAKFRREWAAVRDAAIMGSIIYQDVLCEIILKKYLRIKND